MHSLSFIVILTLRSVLLSRFFSCRLGAQVRSSERTVPDQAGVNAAQRLPPAAPSVAGWRPRWLPRTRIGVEFQRLAAPPRPR